MLSYYSGQSNREDNVTRINPSTQLFVRDIALTILLAANDRNNEFIFDIQKYSNPRWNTAYPGKPTSIFDDNIAKIFNDRGFIAKPIFECYGSTSNCDYGCCCGENIKKMKK